MILTRISVRNPVFATMMMAALLVLGVFGYQRLGVDQFPNIDFPIVVVTTTYPGASPESVESDVTRKIENAVNTVSGVKTITSTSYEGRSVVVVEFNLSTNSEVAVQDVREKVAPVAAAFRREVDQPIITRFNPDDQPILSIAVNSATRSLRDLTTLADQDIVRRLQSAPGVGRATIVGGQLRQIRVDVDPERLRAQGIGIDQVVQALQTDNQMLPAGSIRGELRDRVVQIDARIVDPKRFLGVVIAQRGGHPVTLGDVARVTDGAEEADSAALVNGKRGVVVDIVKVQGGNTIAVADGVLAEIAALRTSLPPDVKLEVIRDSARGIRNSVANVQSTLLEGAALTIAIVFVFLGSWRSTVITGLTLPIAVLGTFAVLLAFGYTLNVMTLMALSLSIGLLIDDAIVVRENITRHIAMGKDHVRAALDGTDEIGLAVLATTFSIVAVFLPVAFMGGIIGRFFLQFGITVAAAVLISLFVSFTLDPMLSSIWYDPAAHGRRGRTWLGRALGWFERGLAAVTRFYRAVLGWSLRHRLVTLALTLGLFAGSILLVPRVGVEFVPPADLGEAVVEVRTPVGASLDYTVAKANQVAAALREFPEVAYTSASINSGAANDKNIASIYVRLKPIHERRRSPDQLAAPFRARLARIPGIDVSVGAPGLGGAAVKPIQVSIEGPDIGELARLSTRVLGIVKRVRGAVDVETSLKAAKPTLDVEVDRVAASNLGVDVAAVSRALRPPLAGQKAGSWKAPDSENYDVMVRFPMTDRTSVADLDRIFVSSQKIDANGAPLLVRLSQVATVKPALAAAQINRRSLSREAKISANVSSRPSGDVSTEIGAALKQVELPPGYRIVFGGATKDINESVGYAGAALLLAVIFIYLILASQFGSFLQPLAIMASLPLALIGVVLGLLVAGSTLNVFSVIGFLTLMGLVTKNAILLVDFANRERVRGASLVDALLEAGTVRLRPILMTTLAMIFGMLPLALALGEGASQRAPMAHAVIGGLISSTILTLVVVPVLLTYLDALSRRVRASFVTPAELATAGNRR